MPRHPPWERWHVLLTPSSACLPNVGELETKTPGTATEAICVLLPTVRTTGQICTAAIAQRPAKVQVLRWRARNRNVQEWLAKQFPRDQR